MGWNTAALFVQDRSSAELAAGLPAFATCTPAGPHVDADTATLGSPMDRLYLADNGGWGQVWDPGMQVVPYVGEVIERDGPGIFAGTETLAVLFQSVTSIYGFWLYNDATETRAILYESGEQVHSVGEPLPFEAGIIVPDWGHDEDFVWAVIEAVTGFDLGSYLSTDGFAVYQAAKK